jgi:hypothetical protein
MSKKKPKPESADEEMRKAAKRWFYILEGSLCVSMMVDANDELVGLLLSSEFGREECYSPQEVNAYVDGCIALEQAEEDDVLFH